MSPGRNVGSSATGGLTRPKASLPLQVQSGMILCRYARSVPAHERLGPDDHHGLEDRWKPSIELDEEQVIAVRELDPTARLALQHDQLVPERGILCFKPASGFEERGSQIQEKEYQRDHRGRR
jgi:hypothetical protein